MAMRDDGSRNFSRILTAVVSHRGMASDNERHVLAHVAGACC